jgi:fucose 4-O-acetylase-like acetyltransferase
MTTTLNRARISQIDTLRGMACILLVFYHTVGESFTSGLKLPADHWLQIVNDAIGYLRMPLFAFISGYVYAYRPYQGEAADFIKSKAQRLLLPVITVGTAFALLQASIPGTNNHIGAWWTLHYYPVAHFWFLQALFLVFMVVLLLERMKALQTSAQVVLAFGVSSLVYVLWEPPRQLGIQGAVYLMPFFLGGLASKRFMFNQTRMVSIAAIGLVGAGFYAALLYKPGNVADLATVVLGLSASFLLLQSRFDNRALAYLGSYSFAVYLLHVFFAAGTRLALTRMGVSDIYVLLVAGVFAGVAGPVVSAMLIQRSQLLNFLMMGARWDRTPDRARPQPQPQFKLRA